MDRRSFLLISLGGVLAAPLASEGQQAPAVYRIGYIVPGPEGCPPTVPSKAFEEGLIAAGYTKGRDVMVDRQCFPTPDLAGKVLSDLLKATPNLVVAGSTVAAEAARDAVPRLPVVFVNVADPVALRMVQSLSRPGSNMTGLASLTLELNAKRIQLLREALPGIRRVSTLSTPDDAGAMKFRAEIEQAGNGLGLQVRHFTVGTAADFPSILAAMKKAGLQAFVVPPEGTLFWTERARIAKLAMEHRLPGMYPIRAQVEAGGLMSYGADQADLYRRAAGYVIKILKGANPADLPVEQPTKFELVINLKTAKALGLTISPSLLARADQIIE
jgi:putative ABC transport system substrate-binding protein